MSSVSHHYVPQLYLKRFTNRINKKVLWDYDKSTGLALPSSPKKCGCEDYFHAIQRKDGTLDTDTIENTLSRHFENGVANLYPLLRQGQPFNPEQWKTFHKFAAMMFVRVPRHVGTINSFLTKLCEARYATALGQPEFVDKCRSRGVPLEALKSATVTATKDFALTTALRGVGTPLALFQQMSWCFYVAPLKSFYVTGDNPVFYCVPNRRGLYPPGLADKEIEVTFPLTKSICAVGQWADPFNCEGEYIPVNEQVVAEINLRTVRAARRFVYGPENDGNILSLVKANPAAT